MKILKHATTALLVISLCLSGCDEIKISVNTTPDTNVDSTPDEPQPDDQPKEPLDISIRPANIDLNGVTGFVIMDNSTVITTKGKANDASPQALYSIDENGDIKVTIFYFEVVEEGEEETSDNEVMKEISNTLQIVPSLVTDLGNYILFSRCQCQIIDSDTSDDVRAICERFIENFNGKGENDYIIRKSDGALFEVPGHNIFTYESYGKNNEMIYIPEYTYMISPKGNIFSRTGKVSKIEDNGDDAITVRQMTHYDNHYYSSTCRNFAIDSDENVYDIFGYYSDCGRKNSQIEIYYATGGFNVHDILPTWILPSWNNVSAFDVITDKFDIPYIFLKYDGAVEIGEYGNVKPGTGFISASITNGVVKTEGEGFFNEYYDYPRDESGYYSKAKYRYLGTYDNCIKWYSIAVADLFDDDQPLIVILSYDTNTQEWSLEERITQIMPTDYDVFAKDKKCYGVTLEDGLINVT